MSHNPTPSPKPTPSITIGNKLATDIFTAVINGNVEQLGLLLANADIETLELVLDIFDKLGITGELVDEIRSVLDAKKSKRPVTPLNPKPSKLHT